MKPTNILLAAFATLAPLGAAACFNWGMRPESFKPAQGPTGARVALRVAGETADRLGELIAVDSAGITIQQSVLVRVAWLRVAALDVDQLGGDYDIRYGETPSPEKRARLALVSRFPQGLSRLRITIDSLIADAARLTTPFADRRVAVERGYVRVGADFPGMGEHWLFRPALLSGKIDPALPTLLAYADVGGRPTLLGVGFVAVSHGDAERTDLPGWPDYWHEHSGLFAEESGARSDAPHVMQSAGDTHVWVMHVWTSLENPEGPLTTDNWALPYLRAGRALPKQVDISASRALSLTVGADAYLRDVLSDAGLRTNANAATVDAAIDVARRRALASADDQSLGGEWRGLVDQLSRLLGPRAVELMEPAHAHHR